MDGTDYWSRLSKLNLYSLERRRERYMIIYCWKIINGLVPNVNDKIKITNNDRRGRLCLIPPIVKTATQRIKTIRDNSFVVKSQKLFNKLPRHVRDTSYKSVESFKNNLDNFLHTISDNPVLPCYVNLKNSNSLIDIV